ncbi:MAG: hypothetical protein SFW36_06445 [Leptolyngbyaceae cyanobacterium bins.59]|nr:hypothetical protein [Leptolyngbyaceae cyanobacterium bins.59]
MSLTMNLLKTTFLKQTFSFFSFKRSAFEIGDVPGLWRLHWQVGEIRLISTFYTRHDQACLLWGVIAMAIFLVAQLPIDWRQQCLFSSVLTVIACMGMVMLTHDWVRAEKLEWLLYSWVGLMGAGLVLTDLSVFLVWTPFLGNLCPLWLGLSAIGYLLTAIGMQSRAFWLITLLHLVTIVALPYVGSASLAVTGGVMGMSLLGVAEFQWDAQGVCGGQPKPVLMEQPVYGVETSG